MVAGGMDFDVFGPVDNKVVVLGEGNIVIVTSNEAERASNEEIPQAIAELKIEPSDSNAEPAADATVPSHIEPDMLATPTKKVSLHHTYQTLIICINSHIQEESEPAEISPKSKAPKSKKRISPMKEDGFEFDDSSRPLRSSRAKVTNYYAPRESDELPKTPKASKPTRTSKKELAAERGIYSIYCG